MEYTIKVDETEVSVSKRDKPVRGRRPLFSQIIVVNGQPGMFTPLLQKEEREVIEDWINGQEEQTPAPGMVKSRKVANAV